MKAWSQILEINQNSVPDLRACNKETATDEKLTYKALYEDCVRDRLQDKIAKQEGDPRKLEKRALQLQNSWGAFGNEENVARGLPPKALQLPYLGACSRQQPMRNCHKTSCSPQTTPARLQAYES